MSHGHGLGTANECKVSMLWNWYTIDACFLSSSWQITTNGAFAATCIGVILMVVALEALRRIGKEYDAHVLREFQARLAALSASSSEQAETGSTTVTFKVSPVQQLVRSVIHALTFGLAYIVMLLAMYYNGYIIICIIVGAGLGKFFCDWMTVIVVSGGKDGNACVGSKATGVEEASVCCG
ncbi:Ctr copper transporter family-domain-containing protein [Immersiella caudata]|uniref:Copper transport protein n=1 Tax=Immersiella caudata TaxID=314043 RepID=A0AA39XF34_9PEZI|nr:Ctr copper transporter family-domain-containing protein [Immersiella caudata]